MSAILTSIFNILKAAIKRYCTFSFKDNKLLKNERLKNELVLI